MEHVHNMVTRFFESIGEGWERIKSSMYENLVRKPAVSMSDAWINFADDTYESRDIIPQTPLTLSSLEVKAAFRNP